jgi:hypothetical protein
MEPSRGKAPQQVLASDTFVHEKRFVGLFAAAAAADSAGGRDVVAAVAHY